MSLLLLFNQLPYHRELLDSARRLAANGDHEISVVTAQMACEIFVEQAFVRLYEKKGLVHLEGPIDDLIPSYNLGNDKVRALYRALTGDDVAAASFWPDFKELVKIRNSAVHGGRRVQRSEADGASIAAEKLVEHVDRVVAAV
jgi:hypothetical protein